MGEVRCGRSNGGKVGSGGELKREASGNTRETIETVAVVENDTRMSTVDSSIARGEAVESIDVLKCTMMPG